MNPEKDADANCYGSIKLRSIVYMSMEEVASAINLSNYRACLSVVALNFRRIPHKLPDIHLPLNQI